MSPVNPVPGPIAKARVSTLDAIGRYLHGVIAGAATFVTGFALIDSSVPKWLPLAFNAAAATLIYIFPNKPG